nr:hypothetical protein [Paenibacillus sp. MSJ-34]
MNIGATLFKQLLGAVVASVSSKKKVYIALDVEVEHLARNSNRLMEILFSALPYEFRRRIGFITYAKEPQSKKYIHVMFVEKGSIRAGDRSIEKDYCFDLAQGRIVNAESDFANQPYLEFAWDHLDAPRQMDDFLEYADLMLADMGDARKMAIASYHELCVFYRIEAGDDRLYRERPAFVLRGILEYFAPPSALERKERLNRLFLDKFAAEQKTVDRHIAPELSVWECFVQYFHMARPEDKGQVVKYLIKSIHLSGGAERKKMYAALESDRAIFQSFFQTVFAYDELVRVLFEPYAERKFESLGSLKEVIRFITDWETWCPQALDNLTFGELAETTVVARMAREGNLTAAAGMVHEQFKRWKSHEAYSLLADRIVSAADYYLLAKLDLDSLTKEDFMRIGYASELVADEYAGKIKALQAAQRIYRLSEPSETEFAGLSAREAETVQQLIRRVLADEIVPANYRKITLAFAEITGGVRGSGKGREETGPRVFYFDLLTYVREHGGSKDTVYSFLKWSGRDEYFAGTSRLYPGYAKAVKQYFQQYDREAFKSGKDRKLLYADAPQSLQRVLDDVKYDLSGGFAKFLHRKGKILGLVLGIVVVAVVGAGILYNAFFKPEAVPAMAYNIEEVTAQTVQGMNVIEIRFESADGCRAFQGEESDPAAYNILLKRGEDEVTGALRPGASGQAFAANGLGMKPDGEQDASSNAGSTTAEGTAPDGESAGGTGGAARTAPDGGADKAPDAGADAAQDGDANTTPEMPPAGSSNEAPISLPKDCEDGRITIPLDPSYRWIGDEQLWIDGIAYPIANKLEPAMKEEPEQGTETLGEAEQGGQ